MKRTLVLVLLVLLSTGAHSQVRKLMFPAGTPEDQALQAISQEADADTRLQHYQEFVTRFASNQDAVAFGYLQIAQHYLTVGDAKQAVVYGDKALTIVPNNLDILMTLVTAQQQLKDPAKVMDYAARGGEAVNGIVRQPRPENHSAEEWAALLEAQRAGVLSSYDFLEVAALNAIADEPAAERRMALIERFDAAFPRSRYAEQAAQYAIYSLQMANKFSAIAAYGEKALAANPDSLATLTLLANALAEDPKGAYLPRAVEYAHKAITLANADAPDADRSRKLSSGLAHSALGYALMRQEKTTVAIAALKTASDLLREDPASYAMVLYRLGFAYAKQKRYPEARQTLNEAIKLEGPFQQPARDLLAKVNAASKQ